MRQQVVRSHTAELVPLMKVQLSRVRSIIGTIAEPVLLRNVVLKTYAGAMALIT